jgi:hypothetical protein
VVIDVFSSVVIPASVKKISNGAFQNCSNLTSVTFKGKDVIIETLAFKGCKKLEKLTFSDGTLKPYKYEGEMGWKDNAILGPKYAFFAEHYQYTPPGGPYNRPAGELSFHSGASAFYGCDKLPSETLSKLKALGFMGTEEMQELENKAKQGNL